MESTTYALPATPKQIAYVDLSRFRSGQVLMLSGLPFKSHGAFPA